MSDESSKERFDRFCREQEAATENGERCWQCGRWIAAIRPLDAGRGDDAGGDGATRDVNRRFFPKTSDL